ncbi:MAG: hypothetical protein ACRC1J_12520, partial [Sandaracinobacteroides sp.]
MNVSLPIPAPPARIAKPALWPLAVRYALREARGGLGALRLLFVCLLLGVLAMAGVGSLASAIATGLADQGQVILGADVEARLTQRAPSPQEAEALRGFGGTVSQSIRMRAMVRGESGAAAGKELLAELKAVDGGWPLYGEALLRGGRTGANSIGDGKSNGAVQQALGSGAVVAEALADQLGLQVG